MDEYMYAKIPVERAGELGLKGERREIDGFLILNQDDLLTFGTSRQLLRTKVAKLGGELLTADQAKELINNRQL